MIQIHTLVGLTLSLFFTEWFGLYPGVIIVPVYLSLYVEQPLRIVGTLMISLATLALYRLLHRAVILYGRRRFIMLILIGSILNFSWTFFSGALFSEALLLQGIGWVIPGLMANAYERQGIGKTFLAMAIVTLSTFFSIRIITLLFFS